MVAAIIQLNFTTMAKRTSRKTKKRSIRRRRVSGVSGIDGQAIALAIGGAFIAHKLQAFLAKDPSKTMLVNISPFAGLALGIGLPMVVKNPMVRALSAGMVPVGGLAVLKKFLPGAVGALDLIPIINGTSNKFRTLPQPSVNGIGFPLTQSSVYKDSMSVISGVGGTDGSGSAYCY